MAFIQDGRSVSGSASIENGPKAQRVAIVQRTLNTYSVAGTTGTIGAALAANASVFAMRNDPSAPRRVFVDRIRIGFTCLVAFTVPLTAGRRLAIFRGNGAAASGGTALAAARKWSAGGAVSEVDTAQGGDVRIATTAALTVTGITFETAPLAEISLVHVGNAGNYQEYLLEFHASESAPIVLEPGQVLALRAPVAFDAAGTWTATVNVNWYEGLALDSSTSE